MGIMDGTGFRIKTHPDLYNDFVNAKKIVVEDLDMELVTIRKSGLKDWATLEVIVKARDEGRSTKVIS